MVTTVAHVHRTKTVTCVFNRLSSLEATFASVMRGLDIETEKTEIYIVVDTCSQASVVL